MARVRGRVRAIRERRGQVARADELGEVSLCDRVGRRVPRWRRSASRFTSLLTDETSDRFRLHRAALSTDIRSPQTIIYYPELPSLMDLAKLVGDLVSVLAFLLVVGAIAWFVITQMLPFF